MTEQNIKDLATLNNRLFDLACAAMYTFDDPSRRYLCIDCIQAMGFVSTDIERLLHGLQSLNDDFILNTLRRIYLMRQEDNI